MSSGFAKTTLQGIVNGKGEEVDRRRRRTISKSGQGLTLSAQLEQMKTGQGGKGWFRSHLWCPYDLPGLRDRTE